MGGSVKPSGGFYELEGDHSQRYIWVGQFLHGLDVLDLGCGFGYGCDYLADRVSRKVLGVDSDPVAIKYASKHYRRNNLNFRLMDAAILESYPTGFDAVVSFEVIEHLENAPRYLEGIGRALNPGGFLYISTPNKLYTERFYRDGKSPNPFHVREYYPDELEELLGRYFSIQAAFRQLNKTQLNASIEGQVAFKEYADKCMVPMRVRRIIPRFLKNSWLARKGLQHIPETRGRWADYTIEECATADIDNRFRVQIFCVQKPK